MAAEASGRHRRAPEYPIIARFVMVEACASFTRGVSRGLEPLFECFYDPDVGALELFQPGADVAWT